MPNRLTQDEALVGRLSEDTDIADGRAHIQKLRLTYDFAVQGGAIGAINLGNFKDLIPSGARVLRGIVHVLTTLTTAGADAGTIALSVEGADDVVVAIAVSNVANAWDAGLQDVVPDGTAANGILVTADRRIVATIAVQAVTAGKFEVSLEYEQQVAVP